MEKKDRMPTIMIALLIIGALAIIVPKVIAAMDSPPVAETNVQP